MKVVAQNPDRRLMITEPPQQMYVDLVKTVPVVPDGSHIYLCHENDVNKAISVEFRYDGKRKMFVGGSRISWDPTETDDLLIERGFPSVWVYMGTDDLDHPTKITAEESFRNFQSRFLDRLLNGGYHIEHGQLGIRKSSWGWYEPLLTFGERERVHVSDPNDFVAVELRTGRVTGQEEREKLSTWLSGLAAKHGVCAKRYVFEDDWKEEV